MPVTDTHRYEPQFIYRGWQPPILARINHFQNEETVQEWLTATPGQFRHQHVDNSDPGHVQVIGVERTAQQLQFRVYYSDSTDAEPPVLRSVQAERQDDSIQFRMETNRASGWVIEAYVTCADGGQWWSLPLTQHAGGVWTGEWSHPGHEMTCMIQAVDAAGNVAVTTVKGQLDLPEMPYRLWTPLLRK
jgi:hypothetical protein